MIFSALIVSLLTVADFSSFTYCHENTRGPYELQCIQLNADAKGEAKFKRREAETVSEPIELSTAAKQKFTALLAATNYLEHPETFESGKKIADLGAKHLTIELPSGKRETWMRIMPGVRNAAKTFHRGHAPEKRANRMPDALKRFDMFPATSIRIM